MAPKIGVTYSHLSNLEKGKRNLTLPVMKRLAETFCVTMADLLTVEMGGLTTAERKLVETFRDMSPPARAMIQSAIDSQAEFLSNPDDPIA